MVQCVGCIQCCVYFYYYVVSNNVLFNQLFCFCGGYFGNVLFFVVENVVDVGE